MQPTVRKYKISNNSQRDFVGFGASKPHPQQSDAYTYATIHRHGEKYETQSNYFWYLVVCEGELVDLSTTQTRHVDGVVIDVEVDPVYSVITIRDADDPRI